jgi:cytochrome c553
MTVRVRHLLYGILALGIAGVAVFWLGLFNIAASSGHWAITDWLLHTAMRRSVTFYSADIEPPANLADPALIRRGAGHFESGCAPCHGSPARPRGAVPSAMTPPPPRLAPRIEEWQPRQLFWIVKHGVKFTGMPAWPAQSRDDEVWALAVFLLALPELSAENYRRLAYGTAEPTPAAAGLSIVTPPPLTDCVRCHGEDGLGDANGAFPRLDIQPGPYLLDALAAYRDGTRQSGIMRSAVGGLHREELGHLAEHYARAEPLAPAPLARDAVPDAVLARGEAIAREGLPAEDVAACLGCHDAGNGLGRPDFPNIHGQYRPYLEQQLELFAHDPARGGARFANLMSTATHALAPPDIEAVAAYFATRDPRPTIR